MWVDKKSRGMVGLFADCSQAATALSPIYDSWPKVPISQPDAHEDL